MAMFGRTKRQKEQQRNQKKQEKAAKMADRKKGKVDRSEMTPEELQAAEQAEFAAAIEEARAATEGDKK